MRGIALEDSVVQLELPATGRRVRVDGIVDANGVRFIGDAAQMWVRIRFEEVRKR